MPAPGRTRGSRPALTLRQKALRALARREYSRVELARKLGGADDAPAAIETLLDEFEASGWLSDTRFAGGAARQRQGRYSQRYILEDLKHKGIAGDTARDAVSALEQDDYATALALWRQRFGTPPADQKEKARQVRFLQSRGFALSVVFRVLREQGVAADDE
ncbi:MAG: recombination regulator RecX [Burkholderiales bacterium]|nr:recombination regulator RecX [Burkholderiales bacterium]